MVAWTHHSLCPHQTRKIAAKATCRVPPKGFLSRVWCTSLHFSLLSVPRANLNVKTSFHKLLLIWKILFFYCIFLIEVELRLNMVLKLNHFQCQWSYSYFGSGITSELIFYIGCWKMQTSSTIKTCQYFVSLLLWNMQKKCYPSLAQLFIFVVFSAQQQSPPPVWLQFTTYAKWQHFWWWQLEAEIANLQPYATLRSFQLKNYSIPSICWKSWPPTSMCTHKH